MGLFFSIRHSISLTPWALILLGALIVMPQAAALAQRNAPSSRQQMNQGLKDLELKADNISRDYEKRTITLEGNVVIFFGDDRISCQSAILNMRKQEVVASGQVKLESEMAYIEGEKITYNYGTRLATIEKGLVQAGQVLFLGDIIKKNSETNYLATSAKYTSCLTCPPGWSVTGQEIEAEIGGYAYIKYPVLRILDFPIFILPRMLIPLKSKRQTGVLVPSLNYSDSGGTAFSLPFFWAISDSQDATYAFKSYDRRGLKHQLEYRYVATASSRGKWNGAFIEDRAFSASGDLKREDEITLKRGFFTYDHHYQLPHDYIHRVNLNFSSDLRYPRDYSDEMPGHGDSALENKMSLTKNLADQHMSIEATHYTNLLKADALADNNDAVHRFPEINYQLIEKEILDTNLFFKFDFNYTQFARRDFSYDDVSGTGSGRRVATSRDGSFDPNQDQIRTGHRYIFQPTLSLPFHIGRLMDMHVSALYNETQYRFNAEPDISNTNYTRNAERRYMQADISAKTKYSGIYGQDSTDGLRYKHEVEPELIYSHIPWAERPDHVFFGDFDQQPFSQSNEPLSNSDFFGSSKVQFDYKDRLFNKEQATFVLSNYLIQKRITSGGPSYQRIATFRLTQSYDFENAKQDGDIYPWSSINSLLDIRTRNFETHSYANSYPYAKITNWYSRMRFITTTRNYFEVSYSRNVILTAPNEYDPNSRTETYGGGVGYKSKYLDLISKLSFSAVTSEMESWEYILTLKPPGDCWDIKFGQKKMIGSDVDYNLSFNLSYGGF